MQPPYKSTTNNTINKNNKEKEEENKAEKDADRSENSDRECRYILHSLSLSCSLKTWYSPTPERR
jgi:CRISPR/Cas system-associated protein Csm6